MHYKKPLQMLPVAAISVCLLACAGTNSSDPVATADGLLAVPESSFREFYQKPGSDLSAFKSIKLEPCTVAFKKDWMRNQNQNRVDISNRVRQEDADRITSNLSAECDEKFAAALAKDPAYTMVQTSDESTLILQPAIVELDVHAPDIRSASARRTFTQSSGEMTLNLNFVDATDSALIARAVDKRRGMDAGHLERTTSVSNKADASIALRRWGNLLRKTLGRP